MRTAWVTPFQKSTSRCTFEARETAAVGHPEPLSAQGDGRYRSPAPPVAHEPDELCFELTTDHGHSAETGQKLGVGRGVEAEKAQLDVRVQAPDMSPDLGVCPSGSWRRDQNSRCLGVRGNGITSRMLVAPVTSIRNRSKPSPKPL
jgi:hypothetical protein